MHIIRNLKRIDLKCFKNRRIRPFLINDQSVRAGGGSDHFLLYEADMKQSHDQQLYHIDKSNEIV